MRSGLEPQNNEAVRSGNNLKQFGAADNHPVASFARTARGEHFDAQHVDINALMGELIGRLGGEHAALEQLTTLLESSSPVGAGAVSDDSDGYCYLKLFDRVEWNDAVKLGLRPTVVELRRFSNGRANPFGLRTVIVTVRRDDSGRLAHVQYNSGTAGLRPVEALAALSKDCRLGGIPDGPSSEFPPGWIPAKLEAYQCWDYTMGPAKRTLDFLSWVGELRDDYCLVSHETSRIRWIVSTSPTGPETANIDIVPPNGKTMSLKRWESPVAHTRFHQEWAVRGDKVFVEAYVWRPAKFTTIPGAPAPTPRPGEGGHGELYTSLGQPLHALVNFQGEVTADGYCYLDAIDPNFDKVGHILGKYPTVGDILHAVAEAKVAAGVNTCAFVGGRDLTLVAPGLYHVVDGSLTGVQFLSKLSGLPRGSRVGATQADAIKPSAQENVSDAAQLAIRPRSSGLVINVPFAAKLTPEAPVLFWDLTAGKKLGGLLAHFESAELVSVSIKATVHKGDGDTIFHLAADVEPDPFKSDMDWVGAPHTLHVSGNSQGATTGEMVLKGNHGFGTQLKGTAVGNPTPIIQGWLETTVTANVLVKAVLSVRVSGTGNPRAVVLPARRAVGNMVNHLDDDDSEDEVVASVSPSGKHVGR